MQCVTPIALSSGISSLSRITRPLPTIIAANLYTSSEHNSKKSHYETLDIPKTATNSEIKSAYYKLSMLYHPDKNASEEAKEKFRQISDAYETLGNHDSRRQYDRMLLAKSRPQHQYTGRTGGFGHSVHRTQSYAPPKYPKNMKIYNFDEWTNQHYGTTFRDTLRRKREEQAAEEMFRQMKDRDKPIKINLLSAVTMIVLVFVTMIVIILLVKYEMNRDLIKSKNDKR